MSIARTNGSEHTQQQILASALRLFATHGYAGTSTQVKIVINPANNLNGSMAWAYAANETVSRYSYLVLTEDTNLTTTPIKFAPPPFIPAAKAAPPMVSNSCGAASITESSFPPDIRKPPNTQANSTTIPMI